MIKLVAAVAGQNLAIGYGGHLPWQLPNEKRHFYRLIRNRIVVMGYHTWCDLAGPPQGAAASWVVTSNHCRIENLIAAALANDAHSGNSSKAIRIQQAFIGGQLRLFSSIEQLYQAYLTLNLPTAAKKPDDLWVIGGTTLYQQLLPLAERMYITLIDGNFLGDCFFPEWRNDSSWQLISQHTRLEISGSYRYTLWHRILKQHKYQQNINNGRLHKT